jgi:hypothetical protein
MCSAVLHYIHIHLSLSLSLWGRTEGQQEGRIYNCSVTDSFNSSFYSPVQKGRLGWAGLRIQILAFSTSVVCTDGVLYPDEHFTH